MSLNRQLTCTAKGSIITGFIFMLCALINAGAVHSAIYYVSSSQGADSSQGDNPAHPWQTLSKVDGHLFKPGDKIFLKRGDVWEESLTVSNSGTENQSIIYGSYGDGKNPVIKCTASFSDWRLKINNGNMKIWVGSLPNVMNTWGAVRNGKRVPKYFAYKVTGYGSEWSAPKNIAEMKNGFFFSLRGDRQFYFRLDESNPGKTEIGARPYGILIKNQSYIIIDSIDVSGPGGVPDRTSETGHEQIMVDNSHHVEIKNLTLSNHNDCGASIKNGSYNCTFENIKCFGHRSTGLYFNNAGSGNKAIGCEVFNCGRLLTDYGDMGLIGILKTPHVLIKKCYVHNNGHANPHGCDAGISFVQSPYGVVYGCYVKDTCDRSLQFAGNSDYGMAAYSIFENWGMYGEAITRWPDVAGVRLGGGASDSTARGCKIYNNLFINGGTTQGDWAALKIGYRINDGTEIKNNIFYNNKGIYEIYAGSKNNFQDWDIKKNLFWGTGDKAIYWNGKRYDHNHITGNIQGNFSHDCRQEAGSLSKNPELSFNPYKLEPQSPCIDSGVSVGLKQDYYGNSVPSGKGVDIGPFEYQKSASDKLGPPENIRIQ